MMGAFQGNAGLLSLWFDEETWTWRFEFANCELGAQHIWWVVHILDLVTIGVLLAYGISGAIPQIRVSAKVGQKSRRVVRNALSVQHSRYLDAKHSRSTAGMVNGLRTVPEEPRTPPPAEHDPMHAASKKAAEQFDVPGSGKKSMRRKKSKTSLNGSPSSKRPSSSGTS
jgi:hypothetical protein